MEIFENEIVFKYILRNWVKIQEIEQLLKLFYEITVKLQKVNYTLSDFYGDWLLLELQLKKRSEQPCLVNLCEKLLQSLENRKEDLIMNKAMLCAIFLDPRFRANLTNAQVANVKLSLINMWDDIKTMKGRENALNNFNDEHLQNRVPED